MSKSKPSKSWSREQRRRFNATIAAKKRAAKHNVASANGNQAAIDALELRRAGHQQAVNSLDAVIAFLKE